MMFLKLIIECPDTICYNDTFTVINNSQIGNSIPGIIQSFDILRGGLLMTS